MIPAINTYTNHVHWKKDRTAKIYRERIHGLNEIYSTINKDLLLNNIETMEKTMAKIIHRCPQRITDNYNEYIKNPPEEENKKSEYNLRFKARIAGVMELTIKEIENKIEKLYSD